MPERTGEELRGVYVAGYAAAGGHTFEALELAARAVYDLGRLDAREEQQARVDAVFARDSGKVSLLGYRAWGFPTPPADPAAALNALGELLATDSRMVPAFSWTFPEVSRGTREDVARPSRGHVRPWKLPRYHRAEAVQDCDWLWDCRATACEEVGVSRTMADAIESVTVHIQYAHSEPPC